MPATRTRRPTEARVYAFKVTILCPNPKCGEPARAPDGGIVFTDPPASIHCHACGKASRVARTIRRGF